MVPSGRAQHDPGCSLTAITWWEERVNQELKNCQYRHRASPELSQCWDRTQSLVHVGMVSLLSTMQLVELCDQTDWPGTHSVTQDVQEPFSHCRPDTYLSCRHIEKKAHLSSRKEVLIFLTENKEKCNIYSLSITMLWRGKYLTSGTCTQRQGSWIENLGGKALALQAWGRETCPQNPQLKSWQALVLAPLGVKASRSRGITG